MSSIQAEISGYAKKKKTRNCDPLSGETDLKINNTQKPKLVTYG
jgi:hypothetical protein